jgi:hypothetical protein
MKHQYTLLRFASAGKASTKSQLKYTELEFACPPVLKSLAGGGFGFWNLYDSSKSTTYESVI